jgi:GntR family transcriptional regulator
VNNKTELEVPLTPSLLNRNSPLPLYHQLYEILRGKITRGEWQPGDMIPTEAELTQQHAVSRTTVRQVLDLLVRDGLIFRQQGRGTFVAHPAVEQTLVRIASFTEDMRRRGFRPGTKVLLAQLQPAPSEIAANLRVPMGEELACLRRLRLADDEPMAIEESYLVHRYCRGILRHDFANQPLRQIMDREYDIRWLHASQTVRAVPASREEAVLLGIQPKAALLNIERVSYSTQELAVEFLRVFYRGDRYVLFNELHA